jgi:hypothetical protein
MLRRGHGYSINRVPLERLWAARRSLLSVSRQGGAHLPDDAHAPCGSLLRVANGMWLGGPWDLRQEAALGASTGTRATPSADSVRLSWLT